LNIHKHHKGIETCITLKNNKIHEVKESLESTIWEVMNKQLYNNRLELHRTRDVRDEIS
jgi:hypothetical protein